MKLGKKVNIILIPHEESLPRQTRMPVWLIMLFSFLGVALLAGIVFVIVSYTLNVIDMGSMDKLKHDISISEKKIDIMTDALNQMEQHINNLKSEKQSLEAMHTLENERKVKKEAESVTKASWTVEDLDNLLSRANVLTDNLDIIEEQLKEKKSLKDNLPTRIPTEGVLAVDYGNITSPFTGKVQYHYGIDLVAERGTPLYAAGGGVVTKSGLDAGYGLIVEISHGSGITSRYCHNLRNVVTIGDKVKRGELIGYMGSTGQSSGTHLHYEIKVKNRPIDPKRFILEKMKRMDGTSLD